MVKTTVRTRSNLNTRCTYPSRDARPKIPEQRRSPALAGLFSALAGADGKRDSSPRACGPLLPAGPPGPHLLRAVLVLILPILTLSAPAQPDIFDVRAHGALGDGVTLDTVSLQAAVDAAYAAGGGEVYLPPGHYVTGTITLKDNVALRLARGAVLLGSTRLDDYPARTAEYRSYTDNYTDRALIYAENATRIAVKGEGIIDGQGAAFSGEYKKRPYLLRFVTCRDVTIEDVTLRDGAMWTVHALACDGVRAENVTIRSRCNKNNDGLDIDGCSNVCIRGCDIGSGDDAIVFKSTSARPCRDITVSDCTLSSDCNALKMGTESNGGFQNIAISNCALYDTRLSGIALEVVDGGVLDGVTVSNITMRNVGAPVFVRLGDRARPFMAGMERPGAGVLRNVSISHIVATGADQIGCSITGLPGHCVENVAISDVRIEFAGGGTADDAARVPDELPEKYPEYRMFGTLPAYGFYVRHARNVRLVDVSVSTRTPDARPPLVQEDAGLQAVRFESAGPETGK